MNVNHKIFSGIISSEKIVAIKLRNYISINSLDAYTQAVSIITEDTPLKYALIALKNNCRVFPEWLDTARGCLLHFLNELVTETPEKFVNPDYKKWDSKLTESYKKSLDKNEIKINSDPNLVLFRSFTSTFQKKM